MVPRLDQFEATPRGRRIVQAVAGIALLGLLALAWTLEPDPRGRGTHEQLGLPSCTWLAWTGRPCPACGMTTSWAWFTHGHWSAAWHANRGGTLLAGVAFVAAVLLLGAAAVGRSWSVELRDMVAATVGLIIGGVTLLEWGARWFGVGSLLP